MAQQPQSRMPPETVRLLVAAAVVITLIVGAVILSALGRPLTELLALVGVAVMPVLVGASVMTVKNTNGSNTELLNLVKELQAQTSAEKQQLIRQVDKQSDLLYQAPPPDTPRTE